jgi:hypothetical protein
MLAKVRETLAEHPDNFIFLYSVDGSTISTTMLAEPEFVAACAVVLLAASAPEEEED